MHSTHSTHSTYARLLIQQFRFLRETETTAINALAISVVNDALPRCKLHSRFVECPCPVSRRAML